eukprot:snap_masked-scaffold_39-processed-gene-0.3-mRNA-1 protein AED:1.00 eAED:1.00 QI:0/-1/0/0/-1/1/1/0/358
MNLLELQPEPAIRLTKACTSCQKKKRSCDSKKPSCTRCLTSNQLCIYEVAKKRGRKPEKGINKIKFKKFSKSEKQAIYDMFLSSQKPENLELACKHNIFSKQKLAWNIVDFVALKISEKIDVDSTSPKLDSSNFFFASMIFYAQNQLLYRLHVDGTYSYPAKKFTDILSTRRLSYPVLHTAVETKFGVVNNHVRRKNRIHSVSCLKHMFSKNVPCYKQVGTVQFDATDMTCTYLYEVNKSFEKVFGFSAEEIGFILDQNINGLLPFGSNLISTLGSEQSLCKYIDNFSIVMGNSAYKGEIIDVPMKMPVPFAVILELQTVFGWSRFQVMAVHSESGGFGDFGTATEISFVPIERLFRT